MNTADEAWREEVRRDLVAAGWPADVARVIARQVSRDQRAAARRPTQAKALAPRANSAQNTTVSLDRAVAMFGLPPEVTAEFRAAGITTAAGAASALRKYLSARNLAASQQELRFHLLTCSLRKARQ